MFKTVDIDNSDIITMLALCSVMNIDNTPFNKRVFKNFKTDRSDHISFKEFTISLWNFCTLTKTTLGRCHISASDDLV